MKLRDTEDPVEARTCGEGHGIHLELVGSTTEDPCSQGRVLFWGVGLLTKTGEDTEGRCRRMTPVLAFVLASLLASLS